MRKLFLLSICIALLFVACSKEERDNEFCIKCTSKVTMTSNPTIEGMDSTGESITEQCGVTNQNLDIILENLNYSTTTTSGGVTITTVM